MQQFLSLRHHHLWLKAFDSHSRIDTMSSACPGGASDKHIISLILHSPVAGALAQSGGTHWCLLKHLLLHKQFCQQSVLFPPIHTFYLLWVPHTQVGTSKRRSISVSVTVRIQQHQLCCIYALKHAVPILPWKLVTLLFNEPLNKQLHHRA